MKISRRSLLKSMLAGSLLSATSPFALAGAASTPRHTVLLTTCAPFGAGARVAGHGEVVMLGHGLPESASLQTLFTAERDTRWFGLVPDDVYVLLSAVARDVGLKQLFEGQHRVDAHPGAARHVLQSANDLHDAATRFGVRLAAGVGWEQAIGHTLAQLAAGVGARTTTPELRTTVVHGVSSPTASRSLISFVMEA